MIEDYSAAKFWWDVLLGLLLLANLLYTWFTTRTKANASAINRVDSRVSEVVSRMDRLESDVRHLPGHEDLGHLHDKVNSVSQSMEGVRGELSAINRTLTLINDHLINGGKK